MKGYVFLAIGDAEDVVDDFRVDWEFYDLWGKGIEEYSERSPVKRGHNKHNIAQSLTPPK